MTKAKTSRPLSDTNWPHCHNYWPTTLQPLQRQQSGKQHYFRILHGAHHLLDNPWIQNIWFPDSDGHLTWPEDWTLPTFLPPALHSSSSSTIPQLPLKKRPVNTMMSSSSDHYITLIQGPPGDWQKHPSLPPLSSSPLPVAGLVSGLLPRTMWPLGMLLRRLVKVGLSWLEVVNIQGVFTQTGMYFFWIVTSSSKFDQFPRHEHFVLKPSAQCPEIRSIFRLMILGSGGVPVILCTLSMLAKQASQVFLHHCPPWTSS